MAVDLPGGRLAQYQPSSDMCTEVLSVTVCCWLLAPSSTPSAAEVAPLEEKVERHKNFVSLGFGTVCRSSLQELHRLCGL